MTQLEQAIRGHITDEMQRCAEAEGVTPETIRQGVAAGTIVVVHNPRHGSAPPLAIGKGLRTKINANIGTSKDRADKAVEIQKVSVCVEAGADAVMDLSTGGDIRNIRRAVVQASPLAVGTVPIYRQRRTWWHRDVPSPT